MRCLWRTPCWYSTRSRSFCAQAPFRGWVRWLRWPRHCALIAIVEIPAPATIDGGDLIVLDRTILVGATSRTDPLGAQALASAVEPFGYRVQTVPVTGCLHLKSAATALDPETLIAFSAWAGANVVEVEGTLITDVRATATADILCDQGYSIVAMEVSEFAKAEGALTCKSVLFTEDVASCLRTSRSRPAVTS